jgi:hypothetical protein
MRSSPTDAVTAIGRLNITGNVIPSNWWRHVALPSGKPDCTAIVLLSEIVYWYRPAEVRDEQTGAVIEYRKRFHGDKLQRSYQAFADQFGFSKREATDALKRLRDAGLVTLELRTVQTDAGLTLSNVLYVEPVVSRITEITTTVLMEQEVRENVTPPTFKRNTLLRSDVTTDTPKSETYTETTTENTHTEIKTNTQADASVSGKRKKHTFDPMELRPENVSVDVWGEWIKHRRDKKQPLTETSCRRQAKSLESHPVPDEVIIKSITCGWTGLFPEKVSAASNHRRQQTDTSEDLNRRKFEARVSWKINDRKAENE